MELYRFTVTPAVVGRYLVHLWLDRLTDVAWVIALLAFVSLFLFDMPDWFKSVHIISFFIGLLFYVLRKMIARCQKLVSFTAPSDELNWASDDLKKEAQFEHLYQAALAVDRAKTFDAHLVLNKTVWMALHRSEDPRAAEIIRIARCPGEPAVMSAEWKGWFTSSNTSGD